MSLGSIRISRLNLPFLISNCKINHNLVNRFSNLTTDQNKQDSNENQLKENDESKDTKDTKDQEIDQSNEEKKPKKRERYAVNTYPHNPPGLMQFFDDPKNWAEDYIKSGRPWKVEELRNKSNSDLHKLWYVLLKERNMLLTMEEAYKKEIQVLPSEERVFKVNESMKNLEQVVRERNKAYWQLEVDKNETGERPVSFRRDIYGRYRWITCSEHLVPMAMNRKWKMFSGQGSGRNINEFMRRYRENLVSKKAAKLFNQAFDVRQLLRRFPKMDMEALQAKYPEIDIEKQKTKLNDEEDKKYRRVIPKFFR